jgi:predicted enzyme related to lactoylglutathione lyase
MVAGPLLKRLSTKVIGERGADREDEMHRSRICQVVLDCNDLSQAVEFWSAALGRVAETVAPPSGDIYARIPAALGEVALLFELVPELKRGKNRMHLDFESDDVEAEVSRLVGLGAKRIRNVQERGFSFWVLNDPMGNEFCVIQTEFDDLLRERGLAWASS